MSTLKKYPQSRIDMEDHKTQYFQRFPLQNFANEESWLPFKLMGMETAFLPALVNEYQDDDSFSNQQDCFNHCEL